MLAIHRIGERGYASAAERAQMLQALLEGKADYKMRTLAEAFGLEDFANAVANVAHLAAVEGVADVPPVWQTVCKVIPITDMKQQNALSVDGMGLLTKRYEHEPSTETKPTDRKESYTPYVYDRVFGISLEAWANDATGRLKEMFRTFGQAAVHTLNDFTFGSSGLLGGTGAAMSDGTALFTTGHGNYATGTDLNFENLQAGIAAMLIQTDESGTQKAAWYPKFLIVPPGKEGVANRLAYSESLLIHAYGGTSAVAMGGTMNWLKKYGLEVVVVPELTSTNWILSADPATSPCVELGFYIGPEPRIEILSPQSDTTFFTRDMYSKATLAFGGIPKSWKTFYKGVQ